jgi:hypothetical protein
MAYAELDKSWVRHFVGYGAVWIQAEPRLDNALIATQSVADGGGRPDSSTENYIKGLVYGTAAVAGSQTGVTPGPASTTGVTFAMPAARGLIQIEANIANQDVFLGALKADGGEVEIDPVREVKRLRMEGRRLAHGLARMLGMIGVRADVFSAGQIIKNNDPFVYSDMESWRRGP